MQEESCERKVTVKPQSAKAKGRNLQKKIIEILIKELGIHPEDLESRSMGAGGEDVIMARAARQKFPFSVECKNQEKLNLWKSLEQAEENSGDYCPLLIFKRNRSDIYCSLKFEDLIKILQGML